jgi:hypothetical protein
MSPKLSGNAIVLTEQEAAQSILSTPRTMARWRSTGTGPRFVKVGRRVVYRVQDLEAWLDRQTRTSTAQRGRRA